MKVSAGFIHYAVSIIALKGISLLMLPVITRFLSLAEYGALNFLVSISAMLSIVLTFGLAEVMFRFSPKLKKSAMDVFIASCIKVTCLIACVFYLTCLLSASFWLSLLPMEVPLSHFLLLMASLSLSTIQAIYLTRYRLLQDSKSYMYVAVAQGALQAATTYLLLMFGLNVFGVLLSGVVTTAFVTLLLMMRHRRLLAIPFGGLGFDHIRYGGFIAVSALSLYALGGAENWFIVDALGAEQLALYFIAAQFSLGVSMLFEPFRLWWFPIRFKRYFESPELAAKGATQGCFIVSVLAVVMMILAPTIINALLSESYQVSASFIPVLCLILVVKTFSELLNLGCYLDPKATYVPVINGVCAVIALATVAFGAHRYGINGVFAGLLLAHTLRFIAFFTISQSLARLHYQYSVLLIAAGLPVIYCWYGSLPLWGDALLIVCAAWSGKRVFINRKQTEKQSEVGAGYEYS